MLLCYFINVIGIFTGLHKKGIWAMATTRHSWLCCHPQSGQALHYVAHTLPLIQGKPYIMCRWHTLVVAATRYLVPSLRTPDYHHIHCVKIQTGDFSK